MRTVLILMLLPSLALAQVPAADAPLADLPGTSVRLATGEPAPFPGRLVSDPETVRREQVNASKAAELAALKAPENVTVTKVSLVAIGAGGLVLGALIAGLVVGLASKPPPTGP